MVRARATILAVLTAFASFFATSEARAGYTHYWKWHVMPERAPLDAALSDMDKIVELSRELLADRQERTGKTAVFRTTWLWPKDAGLAAGEGDGGGDAGAAGEEMPAILFNGIGEMSHETFAFPLAPFTNNPDFSFVKTAYKPYDVAVVACLIAARDHFTPAQLEISSDGQWLPEWHDGAMLYTKALGRAAHDPLSESDASEPPYEPSAPVSRVRWLWFAAGVIAFLAIVYFFRPKS